MKLDLDNTPLATQQAAKVYINGKEQKHSVVEVDDEAQTAKVYARTVMGMAVAAGKGGRRHAATRMITKATIRIVIPAGVPFGPYETPEK